MADPVRRFDDQEADAILRRVLDRHRERGSLARKDLVDIARQFGASPDEVDEAIAEQDDQAEVDREVAAWKVQRAELLRRGALAGAIVNAAAIALNALLTPGLWWSAWLLALWAVGMVAQAVQLRQGPWLPELASVQRRDARRAERAQRRRAEAERAQRLREGGESLVQAAEQLGGALQQGVTAVVQSLRSALEAPSREEKPASTGVRVEVKPAERPAQDPGREEEEIEAELSRLRARKGRSSR